MLLCRQGGPRPHLTKGCFCCTYIAEYKYRQYYTSENITSDLLHNKVDLIGEDFKIFDQLIFEPLLPKSKVLTPDETYNKLKKDSCHEENLSASWTPCRTSCVTASMSPPTTWNILIEIIPKYLVKNLWFWWKMPPPPEMDEPILLKNCTSGRNQSLTTHNCKRHLSPYLGKFNSWNCLSQNCNQSSGKFLDSSSYFRKNSFF